MLQNFPITALGRVLLVGFRGPAQICRARRLIGVRARIELSTGKLNGSGYVATAT